MNSPPSRQGTSAETHPDSEHLAAYAAGRLAPGQAEPIERHLRLCASCLRLVEKLPEASLLPQLRQAFEQQETPVATPPAAPPETVDYALSAGEETHLKDTKVLSPKVPDVAGYEVLETLGRGGMGVVYKARHRKLNRLVALKMILAGPHAGPELFERFRREAQAVARLRHPNIVQIYEVGEAPTGPFLSLEFVEGGSLAQKLAGNPQAANFAAQIVQELAEAMHAAHAQGIIHRDLKPANVLLRGEGQGTRGEKETASPLTPRPSTLVPLITDFGLAKQLDAAVDQTQTGDIMGTPSYMAPEQAAGDIKAIGPATDVYALGAILYEILTGRPPFKAESPLETLLQVKTLEPVPPRQLQPKVPRDLETICLKCLHKEPGRRYGDAGALADDLRRFQVGEPILARPVGQIERTWRWCRRNPALATALFSICATIAVAFILIMDSRNYSIGLAAKNAHLAQDQTRLANEMSAKAKTEETLRKQMAEKAKTEELLRKQSELQLLKISFEQAQGECEKGNVARGVLMLAQCLSRATKLAAHDTEWSIRMQLGAWTSELAHLRSVQRLSGKVAGQSPDAAILVTANQGSIQLWDMQSSHPLGKPMQGDQWAFSPNSKILAVEKGSSLSLWDVRAGNMLGPPLTFDPPLPPAKKVLCVTFSPDGTRLLAGGDDLAQIWDVKTGHRLGKPLPHKGWVTKAAFSPDNKRVLTASADWFREPPPAKGWAQLWDAETGLPVGKPLELHPLFQTIAFSPDGKTFVLSSPGNTAQVWEIATSKPIGPALDHVNFVDHVIFSPDGQRLLTASAAFAYLWDPTDGRLLHGPLKHKGRITGLAGFSPDGEIFVTRDDQTLQLWETETGKPLGVPLHHPDKIADVKFTPEGAVRTATMNGTVRLWEPARKGLIWSSFHHDEPVSSLAFSPDGKTVVTGSWDHTASMLEAKTGNLLGLPLKHSLWVDAVALSENGKVILTGCRPRSGRAGEACLWRAETKNKLGSPLQHKDHVMAVAFSPDGRLAVSGSADHTAQLWESQTGNPVGAPLKCPGNVYLVKFSPDGKTLLTANVKMDGKQEALGEIRFWETATGKSSGPPLCHQLAVRALAFGSDGKSIITATGDGAIRQWIGIGEENPWERVSETMIRPPLSLQDLYQVMAISPDVKTYFTGSELREMETGRVIGPGFQGDVRAATFSPDGKTLLTGFADRSTKLWNVDSLAGNAEEIAVWAQVVTGMELDDNERARLLDVGTWQERHERAKTQERNTTPRNLVKNLKRTKRENRQPKDGGPDPSRKTFAGELAQGDPRDKRRTKSPHKFHACKMLAGTLYTIDLKSKQFDAYLRIEDSKGTNLAEDDDSGGGFDARLRFQPKHDDTYRIIVTSFRSDARGAYTVTVQESPLATASAPAIKFAWPAEALQQGKVLAPDLTKIKPLRQVTFDDPKTTVKGKYFIQEKKGWQGGWNKASHPAHFACEVVGRVSNNQANAWGLAISSKNHGIRITVTGDGHLEVRPSYWEPQPQRGPKIGPISHPALKRGTEPNALLVVLRQRLLEIYVNGVAVCDPVLIDRDVSPGVLALCLEARQTDERAEFLSMKLWSAEGLPTPAARGAKVIGKLPAQPAPLSAGDLSKKALAHLRSGALADAEALPRQSLDLSLKREPDSWQRFHTQALFGACFLAREKYADAEKHLR